MSLNMRRAWVCTVMQEFVQQQEGVRIRAAGDQRSEFIRPCVLWLRFRIWGSWNCSEFAFRMRHRDGFPRDISMCGHVPMMLYEHIDNYGGGQSWALVVCKGSGEAAFKFYSYVSYSLNS